LYEGIALPQSINTMGLYRRDKVFRNLPES
jgi:hypothetical protein